MKITINNLPFENAYIIFINDSWLNSENRNNKERFITITLQKHNFQIDKTDKDNIYSESIGMGTDLSSCQKNRELSTTKLLIQNNLHEYINQNVNLLPITCEFLFSVCSNIMVYYNFKKLYYLHYSENIEPVQIAFLTHWAYLVDNIWMQKNDPVALLTIEDGSVVTLDKPPNIEKYKILYQIMCNKYIKLDIDRGNAYRNTLHPACY